ncbi:MAG: aspartate/glutamate racemase family protein [candidate division KSB1 bacterium]|nr:aspartate/glutamate racemase family protein [candidate division KSB1 bacterium]MDZ7317783.1 aspartate/glutamate racemase family protein [candidate division KSB1 bacterium]MDZ7341686.1 aspartate/glutamate racemase family protein [candidate division KSB1 bacterium]
MRYWTAGSALLVALIILHCSHTKDYHQMMHKSFYPQKDVTILVTDSGLGGLSVAAELASRLPGSGLFENIRLVFFNSLFHNQSGYNSLKNERDKIRIFDAALAAMATKYQPDLLLIACNTLSVLYDKTAFSRQAQFPVIGIVETGVELIEQQFRFTPQSAVIIFATETTIGSHAHKKLLMKRGFHADQIIEQACPGLAGSIERGYNSQETTELIQKYVTSAIHQAALSRPIFASLNCTHYGYSRQQFQEAFARAGYPELTILDPNPRMAEILFQSQRPARFPTTQLIIEVVSKTEITAPKIVSLGQLLGRVSPATAEALKNYRFEPNLFDAPFDTSSIEK